MQRDASLKEALLKSDVPSFFAPLQQENIRTQVFVGLVANSSLFKEW